MNNTLNFTVDFQNVKQVQENFKKLTDEVSDLREKNIKLRLELYTLRFKESQEQRFIWWVWNVYSRNVNDLILSIMGATTYDTEGEAKEGKYALPKHCFDLMKRIDEYTEHIYDGTYLDVEISTDAKKGIPENKPAYNENAKYTDSLEYLKGCYDKPSPSDVSVTQDVLTDIKTPQSIENTNPDYYNHAKTSTDNNKCSWIQEDDPDIGLWRTGCKNTFYLDADKPSDNSMKYCCYCGREIKEED